MRAILYQNIYVHAIVCMCLYQILLGLEYTQKRHHVWITVLHCRDDMMINAHIVLKTQ